MKLFKAAGSEKVSLNNIFSHHQTGFRFWDEDNFCLCIASLGQWILFEPKLGVKGLLWVDSFSSEGVVLVRR